MSCTGCHYHDASHLGSLPSFGVASLVPHLLICRSSVALFLPILAADPFALQPAVTWVSHLHALLLCNIGPSRLWDRVSGMGFLLSSVSYLGTLHLHFLSENYTFQPWLGRERLWVDILKGRYIKFHWLIDWLIDWNWSILSRECLISSCVFCHLDIPTIFSNS